MFGYDDDGSRTDPQRRFEYRPGQSFEVGEGQMFAAGSLRGGARQRRVEAHRAEVRRHVSSHAWHAFAQRDAGTSTRKSGKSWAYMKRTHTSEIDRVLVHSALLSFYTIFEHGEGRDRARDRSAGVRTRRRAPKPADDDEVQHYKIRPDGTIDLQLPVEDREVSAVLVQSRGSGGFAGQAACVTT